jgi:tagatose-1,6-bisphosphate aldolase
MKPDHELLRFKKGNLFSILAFDHRGSFIESMQKHSEKKVEPTDAIRLKKAILEASVPFVSGILIDEDYGLPAYKEMNTSIPVIMPTEKTGYEKINTERVETIARTGKELMTLGANASKLLLYVNGAVASWKTQMSTAKQVILDSEENNLPIFLEFVLYASGEVHPGSVYELVKKATDEGVKPTVWKIPYPGNEEECLKISQLLGETPWVLLTGGVSFDVFKEEYTIAKQRGCSGFVAGRSIWQEACELFTNKEALENFLKTTLQSRLKTLVEIV